MDTPKKGFSFTLNGPPEIPDYREQIKHHLVRFAQLTAERTRIDEELTKLRHLLRSLANMLSGDDRKETMDALEVLLGPQMGLTDAIRNTLRQFAGIWMSPIEIRDKLRDFCFDFDSYTSNPLASIHSVLKRFPPEQVETRTVEGGTEYRLVVSPPKSKVFDLLQQIANRPMAKVKR